MRKVEGKKRGAFFFPSAISSLFSSSYHPPSPDPECGMKELQRRRRCEKRLSARLRHMRGEEGTNLFRRARRRGADEYIYYYASDHPKSVVVVWGGRRRRMETFRGRRRGETGLEGCTGIED